MTDEQLAAPSEAADESAVSVDTEAPEAAENTEGQGEPQPAEGEQPEEKTKSKERRERREARDRAQREEAEANAQRIASLEVQRERIRKAVQGIAEPRETDFQDPYEFVAAKAAFNQARMAAQMRENEVSDEINTHKSALSASEKAQREARVQEFGESLPEARARYADFDQVLAVAQNASVVSDKLADLVLESEKPHDLAYHLGKNPDLARRLSAMSPVQAAREIGRIEASLSQPKAKTLTSAPNPTNPARGSARPTANPDAMSAAEWRAARESGWKP